MSLCNIFEVIVVFMLSSSCSKIVSFMREIQRKKLREMGSLAYNAIYLKLWSEEKFFSLKKSTNFSYSKINFL